MTSAIAAHASVNFRRWCDAVEGGNPDTVARLYTHNVTFLPTLAGSFIRDGDGARQYFVHFLAKQPRCVLVEEIVQAMGDDAYVHSGMYDFTFGADGTSARARFTFVWVRQPDGMWVITHHHSSLRPDA